MPEFVPITGEVSQEDIDRFFAKTRRVRGRRFRKDLPPCLLWTAATKVGRWKLNPDDPKSRYKKYGVFRFQGRTLMAHRFALYIKWGEDPGPSVDHLCHHPDCVEWSHLQGGSITENNATRRVITSEYCINGHERNEENIWISPTNGKRMCRACGRDRDAKRYKKRYAADKERNTHTSEMRDFCAEPKLSFEIAEEIRAKYEAGGTSQRKLAREYQVSQPMIGLILRGEAWVIAFT